MRLLFVLPSFPFPPSDGGRAKIFNILRYLSVRHKCDLICFGDIDRADVAGLRQHISLIGEVWIVAPPGSGSRIFRMLTNLILLRPPSFARYFSPKMSKLIDEIMRIGNYDAIHFDIINMAPYQSRCQDLPSVHSPNDATSLLYLRLSKAASSFLAQLRLRFVSWLLVRYECSCYSDFSVIHVVSEMDRNYLARLVPGANIMVVPITSGYSKNMSASYLVTASPRSLVITVCGNLSDPVIALGFQEFLENVLPSVSAAYSELRVRVLSRRISASLKCRLQYHPNVEYLDWVDSYEEFLSVSDVILLPDKAGAPGAKTRTIQSMALGLAVLGSTSAFEGINVVDGYHCAIYTTHEECRELLLRMLADRKLRIKMGTAAACLAADQYSLEYVGPQYENMYLQAIIRIAERKKIGKFSFEHTND
jgi:glycosyltransferase involved in cell wall biosynthesis